MNHTPLRHGRTALIFFISCFLTLSSVRSQIRPTADEVFAYLCAKQIAHPEIVIKQAILETGWFKAPFLMTKNNIFGFRTKKYMTFKSWKDCVDYYKKWQEKRYLDPTEDYYAFLLRVKYAVKAYPTHLKKINYTNSCPTESNVSAPAASVSDSTQKWP